MARTVEPEGSAVREARLKKGWRTQDLADKAECSKRTVESVEAGKAVYPFTLSQIADALAVPVESLVKGAISPKPKADKPLFRITLSVDVDFFNFDQTEDLTKFMAAVQALANTSRELEATSVRNENSIAITFQVTAEELNALVTALRTKQREWYEARQGGGVFAGEENLLISIYKVTVEDDESAPADLRGVRFMS